MQSRRKCQCLSVHRDVTFKLNIHFHNIFLSIQALRSSTHSPLDSTGSATESTISSAANEESSHAISNGDPNKDELDGKDLDGSSAILNDTSSDDATKTMSAIDASSTNEEDDSGNFRNSKKKLQPIYEA